MRSGSVAAIGLVCMLATTAVSAEPMAGNTQFIVGQRYLDDFWKPLDRPVVWGFGVDFAPEKSPVHVAFSMFFSGDRKTVSTPFLGDTGHVENGFLEMSAGGVWLPVKHGIVRPYLGGGVAQVFAWTGSSYNLFDNSDGDHSFGLYADAGVFFKVGDVFQIGVDGRLLEGTSISIAGFDGNANYGQIGVMFGFSWGGGHSEAPPEHGTGDHPGAD